MCSGVSLPVVDVDVPQYSDFFVCTYKTDAINLGYGRLNKFFVFTNFLALLRKFQNHLNLILDEVVCIKSIKTHGLNMNTERLGVLHI